MLSRRALADMAAWLRDIGEGGKSADANFLSAPQAAAWP
jgi:hypothetical protein